LAHRRREHDRSQKAVELNAEVARGIRRTLQTAHPDALLIAEHGFDASSVLAGTPGTGR